MYSILSTLHGHLLRNAVYTVLHGFDNGGSSPVGMESVTKTTCSTTASFSSRLYLHVSKQGRFGTIKGMYMYAWPCMYVHQVYISCDAVINSQLRKMETNRQKLPQL